MIDFGLVSLFAIQLILQALAFHSWRGIKGEIEALGIMRDTIADSEKTIEAINKRMDAVEESPKSLQARIRTLESENNRLESLVEKNSTLLTGLNARISSMGRLVKQKRNEMVPASEDDDTELEAQSPGTQIDLGIPRSFGKIRKVG